MAGLGAIQGMINSFKSNRAMGKNSGSLKKKTDAIRTYKRGEPIEGKKLSQEEFEIFKKEVAERERKHRLKIAKLFGILAALTIVAMYLLIFVA